MVSIEALTQKYIPSNNIEQKRKKKENIHSHGLCNIFERTSRRTMPYSTLRKKKTTQKNQTLGLVVSSFVPFVFHSLNWNHCVPIFSQFFSARTNNQKKV